jgi:ABC-2 type transport system ATP-binding protein
MTDAMADALTDPAGTDWGLRGVSLRHGDATWLEDIDLDVRPGQVTAVVGGDGAGKTTLLRVLVGALAPTSGVVRRPGSQQIGFVAARTGLYPDLTSDENLAFVGAAYGLARGEIARRSGPLLERMGLLGARDRLTGDLSGGMRQKLALAAAILHEPRLLALDEPTTGVDPVSRAELWHLLAGVAAAGCAIVVATTYLDEAERAARVLLLHEGRPLAAGTPDAIVAAMPGRLGQTAVRPREARGETWRRGRSWRVWARDGRLPTGVGAIEPDLEDAAVVAQLAHAAGGGA